MSQLNRILSRIEFALSIGAAFVMFAIMMIVASDVAMRYIFNEPFGWSYDLVSLYLGVAVFYFSVSQALATHAHVGVDILHYYVSQSTRRVFEIVIAIVSTPVFALIAGLGAERAAAAFAGGDVLAGAIAWPTWASIVLVPIGAGLVTLRLILNGVCHAIALFGGPEIIPLPVLARSAAASDEAIFE